MNILVNKNSGELKIQLTGCEMAITSHRLNNFMRYVWSNGKITQETSSTEVWDINPTILRLLELGFHFPTAGLIERISEYATHLGTFNKSIEARADRVLLTHKILQAGVTFDTQIINLSKNKTIQFSGTPQHRCVTLTTPNDTTTVTADRMAERLQLDMNPKSWNSYFTQIYEMIEHPEKGFHALTTHLTPTEVTINDKQIAVTEYYSLYRSVIKAAEANMSVLGVVALS
jgi:archaellin